MLTRAAMVVILATAPAGAFELELPVDCALGSGCLVQQYADHDPGPGVSDFACGTASYDGHDGTDIRLKTIRDIERGVAVRAAAAGTIKSVRDGMADRQVRDAADQRAIAGRDCGNGVLIDHGGGWQTQYCHLRHGSVRVKAGEKVDTGAALGEIGMSGNAAFPHLHLTVRKDGVAVDPFSHGGAVARCDAGRNGLWSAAARAQFVYKAGEVLELGFAGRAVSLEELDTGLPPEALPAPGSGVLVAHVRFINLKAGDRLRITFRDAAGVILAENEATPDRGKAIYMLMAGRKRLKPGRYTAEATIERAGETVARETASSMLE